MYQNHVGPQMQIVSLRFVETGTYNPMYNREYVTDVNNLGQARIAEATDNGQRVNAFALAGVAHDFMQVKATVRPEHQVQIQNGWDRRRLRFIAEIHYPSMAGGKVIQYVSGWTNHLGIGGSLSRQAIDPNMTLHFHNSILLQEVLENTPMGPRMMRRLTSAAQILAAADWQYVSGGMGSSVNSTRLMRPEDLLSNRAGNATYGAGQRMVDLRQSFSATRPMVKTRYSNGSASQYLAATMNGTIAAMNRADYDDQAETIYGEASAIVKEDTIAQDNFMAWLQGRQILTAGGFVSWGELCAVDQNIDHVAEFYVGGQVQQTYGQLTPQHNVGETAYWHSAGNETMFATMIAQSLPAAMLDNMVVRASFKATNRLTAHDAAALAGGVQMGMSMAAPQHSVMFTQGFGLTEIGLQEAMLRLKQLLVSQILPDASKGGLIKYDLEVTSDVFGETRIRVSIDGQQPYDFCAPSFCDNLIVPVVTTTTGHLDQTASDLQFVIDNISAMGGQGIQTPAVATPSQYGF